MAAEEKGVYRAGPQVAVARSESTAWLLAAVRGSQEKELPLGDLLRTPELFVFLLPRLSMRVPADPALDFR